MDSKSRAGAASSGVDLSWIRVRRKNRGLTMQQVAQASGLTVGFISQIERGITMPSLSSLVSVAHALDVPVGDILRQPSVEKQQTRGAKRPVYAVGANSATYERVSSSFPGSVLRSVIVHEPPGHRAGPVSHEGEELMYVLQGAITVEIGGERTVLAEGDSVHFDATRTHSTWNHTKGPATILWTGTMCIHGETDLSPLLHGRNDFNGDAAEARADSGDGDEE